MTGLSPNAVRRRTRVASLVVIVVAVPIGAVAQTGSGDPAAVGGAPGTEAELDELVVEGLIEDGTGPVDGQANPVTRAGTKAQTPLVEVPQSVSIVGAETLDERNVTRVSEALRYVPGVFTDVYGDDTDYDWHVIRGFQSDQSGVFWDDMQNLAFAFGSFFVDPVALERVEVLRGPSSALYGGSSPGGLLNYVSKRPGERVREASLGLSDEVRVWASADVGDALGSGDAWRVVGRIEGGERHDDFNEGVRGVLSPSYTFRFGGGTELTLIGNLVAADEKHSGGSFLPYFGTVESTPEFGRIDSEANYSDPDWDRYTREQGTLTAILERDFAVWSLFGTARIGVADVEESYFYPVGYTDGADVDFAPVPADEAGTLSLFAFEHDSLTRTAQTDLRASRFLDTGPVEHDLLLGLDARAYELEQTQAFLGGFQSPAGNPIAPGTPTLDEPFVDGTTTQNQLGLYVQDQLRFGGGWITTLNLRHDVATTETDGLTEFERDDSESSGRVALAYRFANDLVPYASVSTFFNPLIASPEEGVIDPEFGRQIELGLKWAPPDGERYVGAALFGIDRENVVSGVFPDQNQLGEVRSQGIEIEGRFGRLQGFSAQASATVIDLEITEDADAELVGNRPTLVPEVQLSAEIGYGFSDALAGLRVGGGVRHLGESEADDANTERVPEATVADLHAGYRLRGWSADLAVTNVADGRYVTGCDGLTVCSYGEGREVNLTLTREF